ncbi:MAG: siroheme synthase [Gammaproteobacteria bacterium]|nr:siroheme synthase [Gammaproteobacteria bacterium]
MKHLPIFLNLQNSDCLIIGGGDIALRKIKILLRAQANVTCISIESCKGIHKLANDGRIKLYERAYANDDIQKQTLVIASTDKKDLNKEIADLCKTKSIPVNVVDSAELSTFLIPAIIDRSPIQIAVSSEGASPVLMRLLRAKLESSIPGAYGQLAKIAGEFRDRVKSTFDNIEDRRRFWERVFSGPISEKIFSGNVDEARTDLEEELRNTSPADIGEVYLVGGGPGDPDLLTFKALRLMQQADIVLYDRLVSPQVMDLVRRDAELVFVGKERDNHAVPQEDINQLLVDLAKQGRRVCRLKGGDPFIFGRGFVTGHLKDGTMNLPWSELAVEQQTIVFYMALVGAKHLSEQLIKHGMRADMPVALIEKGTTDRQKVYTTTLKELPDIIDNNDIKPPTLIFVGEVVKLREKLNWFN